MGTRMNHSSLLAPNEPRTPISRLYDVIASLSTWPHTGLNNESINLKLYLIVVENAQMTRTMGIFPSRSRSQCDFEIFPHLPQHKLSFPVSQLYNI